MLETETAERIRLDKEVKDLQVCCFFYVYLMLWRVFLPCIWLTKFLLVIWLDEWKGIYPERFFSRAFFTLEIFISKFCFEILLRFRNKNYQC